MTSISHRRMPIPWLLAFAIGCAMTTVGDGDGDGDGDGSCRDACDQLKQFQCNDAADHAACYADCDAASADEIELFEACVDADICDPECIANLHGGFADDGSGGQGEEGGEVEEGGVVEEGGEVEEGGPEPIDPVVACQDACDTLLFFMCIDAAQQSDCRALCSTAATDPRDTFVGCVEAGVAGCMQDCWGVFEGAG